MTPPLIKHLYPPLSSNSFFDSLPFYDKLLDAFVMKYAERVNQVHKQMLPKKVDLSETYVVFTKYIFLCEK